MKILVNSGYFLLIVSFWINYSTGCVFWGTQVFIFPTQNNNWIKVSTHQKLHGFQLDAKNRICFHACQFILLYVWSTPNAEKVKQTKKINSILFLSNNSYSVAYKFFVQIQFELLIRKCIFLFPIFRMETIQ